MTKPITAISIVSGTLKSLRFQPSLLAALALGIALTDILLLLPLSDLTVGLESQSTMEDPTLEEQSQSIMQFVQYLPILVLVLVAGAFTSAFCVTMWVRATWPGLVGRFEGGLAPLLHRSFRATKHFLIAMLLSVLLFTAFATVIKLASQGSVALVSFATIVAFLLLMLLLAALVAVSIFGVTSEGLDHPLKFREAWHKTQAFHKSMVGATILMTLILTIVSVVFALGLHVGIPTLVVEIASSAIVGAMSMILASGMAPIYAAVHKDSDLKA